MKPRHALFITLMLGHAHAGPRAPLTPDERTNGAQTLAAVDAIALQVKSGVALIVNDKDRILTTATWVGSDGYFLTKASDAPMLEKARIRWDATAHNLRGARSSERKAAAGSSYGDCTRCNRRRYAA